MVIDTHGSVAGEKNKIERKNKKYHVAVGDWAIHCGSRWEEGHITSVIVAKAKNNTTTQPLPDLP